MDIIYTNGLIPEETDNPSIFLAGPTPRSNDVVSWRPDAINILQSLRYNGLVFYPEYLDGAQDDLSGNKYVNQVEWEHNGLNVCRVVLVWVPRDLKNMPSFTTNVEFGLYVKSGKLFYGRPDHSPKNGYLDYCYEKFTNRKPKNILSDLVKECMEWMDRND